MPAEHDLSPEELEEFAQHGIVIAPSPPAANANEDPEPPVAPASQEPAPVEPPVSQEPAPAAPASAPAPVDPNAPPVDPATPPAPPPGYVPHAALHEERRQRQEVQRQMLLLQTRTNAMLAAQQPAPLELPDMQQDPAGYLARIGTAIQEQSASTEEARIAQSIDTAFEQDELMFSQMTPDYDVAAEHYAMSRANELLALGYTRPQAMSAMVEETRELARQAWQRGVPAAEVVYSMAKARGYRSVDSGAAPTPAPTPPAPQNHAPAPAVGAPSAAAVVAAAQAGQAATRTLSGGSAAPTTAMNAEALLSMSDDEFEAYLKLGSKGANARFAAIG